MRKVMTVVGARPQFIKASVLSRELAATKQVEEILVHTGQHFDQGMSGVFFDELDMKPPKINLAVNGGTHGENTGRMLEGLERAMLQECPDVVVVYGDTDSTLAGTLAAAKFNIPVAHGEAGLRSGNRSMPEEVNRLVADRCADILYAPSESARRNLLAEGMDDNSILVVGDIMYDCCIRVLSDMQRSGEQNCSANGGGQYVLATIHRKGNVDNRLKLQAILSKLGDVDGQVVMPLHPRTKSKLREFGLSIPRNVACSEPLGYRDLMSTARKARYVATDSGGLQKEAYFLGVPCITIREETEWTELLDAGVNVLVPAASKMRLDEAYRQIIPSDKFPKFLYGHGDSGKLMVKDLMSRTLHKVSV